MKIEALRRSLVRYFRDAATSARGEIARTPAVEALPAVETLTEAQLADLRNFANSAPEPAPAPPDIDWATWCKMRSEHRVPGWAFCRYALRGPPPHNAMEYVFGMTQAPFGIHTAPVRLCGELSGMHQVWVMVHLGQGFCLGLFRRQAEAVAAAEIAARMSIDWDAFDPDEPGFKAAAATLKRVHRTWFDAAIVPAPFHAHPEGEVMPIVVWHIDHEINQLLKPTRLS